MNINKILYDIQHEALLTNNRDIRAGMFKAYDIIYEEILKEENLKQNKFDVYLRTRLHPEKITAIEDSFPVLKELKLVKYSYEDGILDILYRGENKDLRGLTDNDTIRFWIVRY